VEGTNQSILILYEDDDVVDKVYQILRDGRCHDFKIIKLGTIQNFQKTIEKNGISVIVACVSHISYGQELIEHIDSINIKLPMVLITKNHSSEINDLVQEHNLLEPILLQDLDERLLLKYIFYSVERAKVSYEIRIRDAIMQSVNFAAESFLNHPDWRTHVKDVLQKISEASYADRVYFMKNIRSDKNVITGIKLMDSWIRLKNGDQYCMEDGKESIIDEMAIAQNFGNLMSKKYLQLNTRELPTKIRAQFHLKDVQSVLLIPIVTNGDWWGLLRFDQCEKERIWKDLEIEALQTAASIFSAAISRQKADAHLKYLATHDYLTNLPNRLLFEDHLRGAMIRSQRSKRWVGLFVVDLDHFKKVNDTYGHPHGDKVLIEVAKRLENSIRASDTVARIGGDEFVVIGEEIGNLEDVKLVGKKILRAFKEQIVCDNISVQIYTSIGISIYPIDSTEQEELMRFADIGLYRAKKQGNTFHIYNGDAGTQLWLDHFQKY
jgi:diguanylate cyclase (GGDEF)-like protein